MVRAKQFGVGAFAVTGKSISVFQFAYEYEFAHVHRAPERDTYMVTASTICAKWDFTCREKPWPPAKDMRSIDGA